MVVENTKTTADYNSIIQQLVELLQSIMLRCIKIY